MGTLREDDPGRRRLLLAGLAALADSAVPSGVMALATAACQPEAEPRIPIEFTPIMERGNLPSAGDIVVIDKKPLLVGKNELIIIPPTYTRNTKFEQYGGRVFTSGGDRFSSYPIRDPRMTDNMFDWMLAIDTNPSQQEMIRKKIDRKLANGGEMLLFFPGFITDDGIPYDPIVPRVDTFTTFLNGLKRGWETWDALYFNYGEKLWIDRYQLANTTRDPNQNARHAKQLVGELKQELPLVKFNFIAHSLGGLFALHAAVAHPDAVNNLVLINSPLKGFEKTAGQVVKVEAMRKALWVHGIFDEKVTDYLFALWKDQAYQKWVSDAVKFLRSLGKRVLVVIDEGDGVVSRESAEVEEVELLTIKTGERGGLIPPLENHGRPLKYGAAISYIGERLGNDMADSS